MIVRVLLLTALAGLAACGERSEAPAPELAGTPCATLTAEAFQQRGATLKNSSTLGAVTLRRQFGKAECAATTDGEGKGVGAGTCEFSSPGVTHVSANGADHYFDIPVGEPATIQVSGGDVRCVLTREQKK
jgi:hypothetical protein